MHKTKVFSIKIEASPFIYSVFEDNPILSATSAYDKPDFIRIFFKSSAISLVKTNIEKD